MNCPKLRSEDSGRSVSMPLIWSGRTILPPITAAPPRIEELKQTIPACTDLRP